MHHGQKVRKKRKKNGGECERLQWEAQRKLTDGSGTEKFFHVHTMSMWSCFYYAHFEDWNSSAF